MQKIAILYDASQAVLSTFDLDDVLRQILSIVHDYFHIQNGSIMLLDAQTQELYIRAQFGRPSDSPKLRLPVGMGITGTAAKLKRPIYAPDVATDPRYVADIAETRSEVAVPLMVRDEVVGVLDCQSDTVQFFDNESLDLLTLFSTQAAIALENARLYSLERRRAQQLEAINAVARQTTAVVDLNELLDKVCNLVLERFPVEHVALLMLESEGGLHIRAHAGKLTPRFTRGDVLPPGAGLAARALAAGKTVIEDDVRTVPDYIPGFDETCSEMCVPLIFFGEKLGILALENSLPGAFPPGDVPPLESVADICAGAIQNAYYFDRVRQLAFLDGLTGIYNRRYFEQRITEEIERSRRYDTGFAVVMLDIDHFKKLNDEFGHLLGDEVLRQVSRLFTEHLRKIDIACRYGGEEFAIIIPAATSEIAVGVADKLRSMVRECPFPGVPRPVTVSAGVAEFPIHGASRDDLVAAADLALYAAKQAGRNRTVSTARVNRASV